MYSEIAIFSLILFLCAFVGLLFKSYRKLSLISLLPLFIITAIAGAMSVDQDAREAGFVDSSDQRRAIAAGFSDPIAWQAHQEGLERLRIAREQEIEALRTPPGDQKMFVHIVHQMRTAYQAARNDMEKGAIRRQRAAQLCSEFRYDRIVGWVGEIVHLSSSSDGRGVLSVNIGDGIQLQTWNNSFSDIGYRTLIDPETILSRNLRALSEGDFVRFSGIFFSDRADCFHETSLKQRGSMEEPEFVFRFTKAEAIE